MPRAWATAATLAKEASARWEPKMRLTVGSETPLRFASAAKLIPKAFRRWARRWTEMAGVLVIGVFVSYVIRIIDSIGSCVILNWRIILFVR